MNEDSQDKQEDQAQDELVLEAEQEGAKPVEEPTTGGVEDQGSPAAEAQAADLSNLEQSAADSAEVEGSQEFVSESVVQHELKWYVVHVYSGFEFKVKQSLEERIRLHNFGPMFGEIKIPQEKVVELVRGKKKTSNRKFFPGYILVQMALNQDTWHLVNETPKVTGFVGDSADPAPLAEDEVARIITQVEEGAASPRSRMSFEQGETVKVVDGPFADFNGTVEEVRPEKGKVKVLISIFGRATPVELDFVQIEKI